MQAGERRGTTGIHQRDSGRKGRGEDEEKKDVRNMKRQGGRKLTRRQRHWKDNDNRNKKERRRVRDKQDRY